MRRLLKYGFVLALAVAVGCYVVLGPPAPPSIYEELDHMLAERRASLEGWRAFLDAHQSGVYAQSARAEIARRLGAPAAAPGAAPTDNGRGYKLSERLASLASYAHSATAKVEQLLLADQAPASGNPPISAQAPADERGESQSAHPVSSAAEGAVPATAAVSHDASQDPNPANGAERSSAPGAVADGGDGGARTRLAALAPDEICQRDEARLAQLRSAPPSLDEATRFANELGCERLRPQILSMMESLAPASAAGGVSQKGPPEPPPREDAPRAWPAAGVVALKSDETCKRDEGRLARLRSTPSGEEAERFASELSCEALRPQLQRLMESSGSGCARAAVRGHLVHRLQRLARSSLRERARHPGSPSQGAFRTRGGVVLARSQMRTVAPTSPIAHRKPQCGGKLDRLGCCAARGRGTRSCFVRHTKPQQTRPVGMPSRNGGTRPHPSNARSKRGQKLRQRGDLRGAETSGGAASGEPRRMKRLLPDLHRPGIVSFPPG